MKKKNITQSNSNPTLSELLEPYLRDPPSPPPISQPQSPPPKMPQPWLITSSHTVQKPPAKPRRRFNTPSTQYYRVHPRNFCSLVQRLTGAGATSDHHRPFNSGEKRVNCKQNAARKKSTSSPVASTGDGWHASPQLNSTVGPSDFPAPAQRLRCASSTLDNDFDTLSGMGECGVQYNQNAAGVEKESTLHDMGTNYWDWCAPPIVKPRTMGSMGEFCWEEDGGILM